MADARLLEPSVTILGLEPSHRACSLNGNSFQQDAIASFNGWQYAVLYTSSAGGPPEPLYVHLGRRKLPNGPWQILSFDDYPQTADDSHNTAQLGVCHGDGTVHVSFDHHCDVLRYRVSVKGLAATPERFSWDARLFTPTLNYLPGLPRTHEPFASVTYPRFGSMGVDMFCSFRDGKAGLGNDHLYLYRPETGRFSYVGKHLTGVNSNPYVHGIDYRNGRLHITWVYRGFVHYDGWDDPLDTKHKQQAGPNGAANNHNICYAFSDDKGYTWKNAKGSAVASLKHGETITNDSDGVVAFAIPRGSGLSNQESQAVDHLDGVHILNRGYDAQGQYVWKHYYRPSEGKVTHETSQAPPPIDFHGRAENMQGGWEDRRLDSIVGNQRGQLAITSDGRLYIVLPKATTSTISILSATRARSYKDYVRVWEGTGLHGEPLIDTYRLQEDGVLSLFIRQSGGEPGSSMRVVVADFNLALV